MILVELAREGEELDQRLDAEISVLDGAQPYEDVVDPTAVGKAHDTSDVEGVTELSFSRVGAIGLGVFREEPHTRPQ